MTRDQSVRLWRGLGGVGKVVGVVLAAAALLRLLDPWTPWGVRNDVNRVNHRVETIDANVRQLTTVVTLQSVIAVEKDSTERAEALRQLRSIWRTSRLTSGL